MPDPLPTNRTTEAQDLRAEIERLRAAAHSPAECPWPMEVERLRAELNLAVRAIREAAKTQERLEAEDLRLRDEIVWMRERAERAETRRDEVARTFDEYRVRHVASLRGES